MNVDYRFHQCLGCEDTITKATLRKKNHLFRGLCSTSDSRFFINVVESLVTVWRVCRQESTVLGQCSWNGGAASILTLGGGALVSSIDYSS